MITIFKAFNIVWVIPHFFMLDYTDQPNKVLTGFASFDHILNQVLILECMIKIFPNVIMCYKMLYIK